MSRFELILYSNINYAYVIYN